MRLAPLIAMMAMMAGTGLIAACTQQPKPTAERRSAAGEVLGGETSDAMLPLDTTRSTSPAGPGSPTGDGEGGTGDGAAATTRPGRDDEGAAGTAARAAPGRDRTDPTPRVTVEAAPMPDMTMPADPEPRRTDGD